MGSGERAELLRIKVIVGRLACSEPSYLMLDA
jgi:hypothetical protein